MSRKSISRPSVDLSDDALARAFAEAHKNTLRFVSEWKRWIRWDGRHWKPDNTLAVQDDVRKFCRRVGVNLKAADPDDGPRRAAYLAMERVFVMIEKLARNDPRLAATPEQWDKDPWLLGTPGGTIDLKTGNLRPARHGDFITKVTSVAPDFTAVHPLWDAFLTRIFAGDKGIIEFVQRLMGYALAGVTVEHVFAFLHGLGANGKTVFTGTLSAILADYAHPVPVETFMISNGNRHPVEDADLAGARLLIASEAPDGSRWNLSKLKRATGGDVIRARGMRENFWSFTPQFLLMVTGNHHPRLDAVDEAIRRRLLLIPFEVTIPPAERDKHLIEKLKAEHAAILAWMVRGCLDWQRTGLNPPHAVLAATNEYIQAEDTVGQWLEAHCDRDPTAFATTTELHTNFVHNQPSDQQQLTISSFRDGLRSHGFQPARKTRGNGFAGLRLKEPTLGGPSRGRDGTTDYGGYGTHGGHSCLSAGDNFNSEKQTGSASIPSIASIPTPAEEVPDVTQ